MDKVNPVTCGGEGSINVSPPLVNDTVNGTVSVNIGESNDIIPAQPFILKFKDEPQTS